MLMSSKVTDDVVWDSVMNIWEWKRLINILLIGICVLPITTIIIINSCIDNIPICVYLKVRLDTPASKVAYTKMPFLCDIGMDSIQFSIFRKSDSSLSCL